ncbi:MAG: methyltransferase domain-containing protein [Imperialibacter sp.]
MNTALKPLFPILCVALLISCQSGNKPYNSKQLPGDEVAIRRDYDSYYSLAACQPGETIASIGAGNGSKEIAISCFVEGITWHLQEIDSLRLHQFSQVLAHHEQVMGAPVKADFNLVLGTEESTGLPQGVFDRVLLFNVYHELASPDGMMKEIRQLLNTDGVLVIMERMGATPGELHGDCDRPKLMEPAFLQAMAAYGYTLQGKQLGEAMSNLMFYTFDSGR